MIAIAVAPRAAAAETVRRVGIVVTVRVNVDAGQARELASELGEVLRTERPVDIIAGAETERRLPADGVPDECVADTECRLEIGRRLDAEELLLLVVVKMGDRIQIDTTWANVASGKTISRPAIVLEHGADRRAVFTEAVPRLLPHIRERGDGETKIVVVPTPGGPRDGGDRRSFGTPEWVFSGVTAASLVTGTVFALSSNRKFSSLEGDDCRTMPCPKGDIDRLRRHALVADVMFGVAGAAAITTLVFYLRDDGGDPRAAEPKDDASALRIGAGPGAFGLSLGGAF